jgi:hypothetical protein
MWCALESDSPTILRIVWALHINMVNNTLITIFPLLATEKVYETLDTSYTTLAAYCSRQKSKICSILHTLISLNIN